METVCVGELEAGRRRQLAEVFVDGFGRDFSYFSRDQKVLADAFEHMFVLERFHATVIDGRIAAIAVAAEGDQVCLVPDAKTLRRHLGLVKGTVADTVVRREFQRPVPGARDGLVELGFIATAERFRGQGAATALLRSFLAKPEYDEYLLEDIADTNTPALNLYRGLGFTEYKRRPVRHTRRTGIHYYISMRLTQNTG